MRPYQYGEAEAVRAGRILMRIDKVPKRCLSSVDVEARRLLPN
jgi:hypothetical protein